MFFLYDSSNVQGWVQVGLNSVLIMATIITLLYSIKDYKNQVKAIKVQVENNNRNIKISVLTESMKIANNYAELMNDISYINFALNYGSYKSLLSKIDSIQMCEFNMYELNSIAQSLGLDVRCIIEKFNNIANDEDHLMDCYYFHSAVNISPKELELYKAFKHRKDEHLSKEIQDIINSPEYVSFLKKTRSIFIERLNRVLNKFEAMSMALISKLADEKLLYPSLHQTFNSTIKLLYVYICKCNSRPEDHYYMYCRELFRKWAREQMTAKEDFNKKQSAQLNEEVML